jgi:cupin 2 domain-containing protein
LPARSQLPDERAPDGNLFRLGQGLSAEELFERVVGGDDVLVERIVSAGHVTEAGSWLVGERDEWVVLLEGEAELAFSDGSRVLLEPGDYVLIPARERHRVESTRADPPCVWLAVHAAGLSPRGTPQG